MRQTPERPSGLLYFLAGALVGAAAAALLAPEPGREMRHHIGDWMRRRVGGGEIVHRLRVLLHSRKNGALVDGRGLRRHGGGSRS